MLLAGFAVAGLALVGALAASPFGWRAVRVGLAMVSVAAFLVSSFHSLTYFGLIDQRRGIETRLAELRSQALAAGSPLACIERVGEALDAACGQTLFASPETLAAANFYTASRLDVLRAAERYPGPRTETFEDSITALRRSLENDAFGLTANVLVMREGCTVESCPALAIMRDTARVQANIRDKMFDSNIARYAANWRTGAPVAAASPPASTASVPVAAPTVTTTGETRAPIPDKYTLPSAASIPPVSIMSDEPVRAPSPAPAQTREQAKDRPAAPPSAVPSADEPPTSAPAGSTPPAAQKQQPATPRRDTARPSAPLSITPTQ
jgi:hypothetical protein